MSCSKREDRDVEVVKSYISAHNAHEVAQAIACCGDDIVFKLEGVWKKTGVTEMRTLEEWDSTLNSNLELGSVSASEDSVFCRVVENNDWFGALGIHDLAHDPVVFIIAEGKIRKITAFPSEETGKEIGAAVAAIYKWSLQTKDSTIAGLMHNGQLVYSSRAAEQWLSLIDRWKASESGRAFLRTRYFPRKTEVVRTMPPRDSLWIFLMAGQSNMAGRARVEPRDTVPDARILTIGKSGKWILAKEPLHYYEPSLTGLDCGMAFAKRLLVSAPVGVSIGMIPCAVGGSSIEDWLRDESYRGVHLMTNFRERAELSEKNGIVKGVLWHQGESDAHPEAIAVFPQRLDSLIHSFRSITGNDSLPVLIGELGSFARSEAQKLYRDSINRIFHEFADRDENVFVIGTADLKHRGDTIHFDSESQRKMGERFAEKYLEIIKGE